VLLAACLVAAVSLGASATSKGPFTRFKAVQVAPPDFACTSSVDFTAMPSMSLAFTLVRPGPVVLMFQGQFGELSSTPGARAGIRMTVDGEIAFAAVAIGSDPRSGLQTFGFNAVSPSLAAGRHVAEVWWGSFPDLSTMCVEERSLIVLLP
jgi:hypothetical protein